MLSFRQKVFFTYIGVFILFVLFLFPFATKLVHNLVRKALNDRATEIIEKIEGADNDAGLIRRLKDQRAIIFFRVSLINDEGKVLYDSHAKRLLGPKYNQEYVVDHPEVLEAFEKGSGYHEDYSQLFDEKFAYMAKAFDFKGKTYVLRTAFPFKYVNELSKDFIYVFLIVLIFVLLLFSMMTWFIISTLTKPIQEIISAVKPYQEGEQAMLPEIKISGTEKSDEFSKLADTLNTLSSKVQHQINSITSERNEKEVLLESLVEGVVAVDPHMEVNFANTSSLKWLGIDKLVGQPFSKAKIPQCEHLLIDCQKKGIPLTDAINITVNGKQLYFDVVASPKKDNTGALLVMQDKTEHHKIIEMRKDFIANASHELKTPITIIRGFAETMHDNPDLPRETMVEILNKIVRNSQRMSTLIKDLLTLADIENLPESRLVLCDIDNLTQKCRSHVLEAFPSAQIQVDLSGNGPFELLADPSLLEMALMNLIHNAAKYSTPPANIRVTIEKTGENILWKISDQGIGIPKEALDHIFERFYTVNRAHSQKMGGSGLGLSIVHTIISKHHGTISVTSEVGTGTTFFLTLPISQ